MNKKHANAVLCKVFDEFVASIDNQSVRERIEKGTIITGGSIVSLLTGEKVNDYDLYFKDFGTCLEVTGYFVSKFNEAHPGSHAIVKVDGERRIKVYIQSKGVDGEEGYGVDDDAMETNITPDTDVDNVDEKPPYRPVFLTSNAITLSNKIQLVIRFYGEPDKIHENYDFVHCTNYWTSWDRKLTLRQEALEAIMAKELIYVGSKYPLCSIIRTRKFIQRGWTINAGQYLKMAFQLNKLDLTDIRVLEDQLVGVDSAYFAMLIDALKTHLDSQDRETASPWKVDDQYVVSIINKIF